MKSNLVLVTLFSLLSVSAFAEEATKAMEEASDAALAPTSQLGEFQAPKNCTQESTASSVAIGSPDAISMPDFKGKKTDTNTSGAAH